MISHIQMIERIAAGALLGGVIGFERDRHGRPVGLRTHLIVSMTAATFMVISAQFVYFQHYAEHLPVEIDGSRIAASVVSGIGFLAGGSILHTGATVQGLTTAAGLWLVTAIGMCAGAGMYLEGSAVTVMGVFALTVLRRLEDKNDGFVRRKISVVIDDDPSVVSKLTASLNDLGLSVAEVQFTRSQEEQSRSMVVFDAKLPTTLGILDVVVRLEALPEVRRVHVKSST